MRVRAITELKHADTAMRRARSSFSYFGISTIRNVVALAKAAPRHLMHKLNDEQEPGMKKDGLYLLLS
jgi:hypothetical protein